MKIRRNVFAKKLSKNLFKRQDKYNNDIIKDKFISSSLENNSDISTIDILHFNDLHGQILPFENVKLAPLPSTVAGATYIASEILKKASQYGRENTLILDAGDWFDGSPEGEETKGKIVFDFFNYLKLDATEVGNHDIRKVDFFDDLIKKAKFPVLGANIIDKKTGKNPENIKPYVVLNKGGLKIGLIGLLTSKAQWQIKNLDTNYEVIDANKVVKKYIKELKEKGIKTIFVLSHLGVEEDKQIAKENPDIDVIIGGHSHTALKKAIKVSNTIITQAGERGEFLGDLSLKIDKKTGKVIDYKYNLEPVIDSKIKEDKVLKKLLDSSLAPISEKYDSIIAKTDVNLLHSSIKPSSLDYLVVDAFRDAGKTQLAFLGSNAVAQNIFKGNITKRKVFYAFPWHEKLVKGKLPGWVIKSMIQHQLKDLSYKKILPSGFKYFYNSAKSEGNRLEKVILDDGTLLQDNKYYSVTINSYLYNYDIIRENLKDYQQLDDAREVLYRYFEKLGEIKTAPDERIIDISR